MTQAATPTQTIQATKPKEKLNKIEQAKTKKHPLLLKQELEHFASIGWEAMDEFERNQGFKWLGFFYRTSLRANRVKPIEAVDIWIGSKVGKDAHLGEEVMKKVPCENLKSVLWDLLIEHFGAQLKEEALTFT